MMTKHLIITALSTAAIAFVCRPVYSTADSNDLKDTHQYKISLRGTDGVSLRMLLITKNDAQAPPTRRSEVVTIPFTASFEAKTFYVWFDTLKGGISGNEGDRVMAEYAIDGERQGGAFGMTIKQANKKAGSFGNL